MGLQALSQEDAEREALYEQMKQAKSQKDAQTKGTVGGIGAAYLVNKGLPKYTSVSSVPASGAASGVGSASQSSALINQTPFQASQAKAAVDGATIMGAQAGGTGGVAGTASGVGGVGGVVGTAGTTAAGGVAGAAGTAAAGTAAAGTAAAAAGGGAAAAGGGAAALAAATGPLAIGIGAAFLLSSLFG